MGKYNLITGLFITALGCNGSSTGNEAAITPPPAVPYSVINSYPHDTASFVQGLAYHQGRLYESTGSPDNIPNNGSWMGPLDLQTGKPRTKVPLESEYFGEGITILNNKIYQITWQQKKGFVYDVNTLKRLREFRYKTEGWGLTNDGNSLIMSDGSSNLYYYHPDSLVVIKTLAVTDGGGPVSNINELEFINGYIYANRWLTPYILKIDPQDGKVVGRLDLSTIIAQVKSRSTEAEFLNGIAYDSVANRIFVTGKKWPLIFEIRFL